MKFEIIIKKVFDDDRSQKASAEMIMEDCFKVKNLRLVEGNNGMFLGMPDHKVADKNFYMRSAYPLTQEFYQEILEQYIRKYEEYWKENASEYQNIEA